MHTGQATQPPQWRGVGGTWAAMHVGRRLVQRQWCVLASSAAAPGAVARVDARVLVPPWHRWLGITCTYLAATAVMGG